MQSRRIVELHPAIVSGIFLVDIAAVVANTNLVEQNWSLIGVEAVLTLISICTTAGWLYGTAEIAAERLAAAPGRRLRLMKLFVIIFLICGMIVSLLVFPYRGGWEVDRHPAFVALNIAFAVSYIGSSWGAAALITQSEFQKGKQSSTFVTFLLLIYLPIGVWFLRRRILSLELSS